MTLTKYTIGFVCSALLTLVAYILVVGGIRMSSMALIGILGALALVQAAVQLVFFLHLGDEIRPRYKLLAFWFMMLTLVIVVVGSLWIMDNLNYNMMHMTPAEKDNYMMTQHDKGF